MAPSLAWFRLCLVIFVLLSRKNIPSFALRPGGDDPIALTSAGSIVLDNGSVIEEYKLRESNPVLSKFINIGAASHKLLQKSGYAYGVLVGIAHSDRDKEFGEGPDRQEWFPMVLVIEVMEAGADNESEDVTVQYEVVVDFDPKGVAAPGLVILEAQKLGTEGAVAAVLEVIPPEPNSFIERNKGGIMMFLGVIIASGVVKFIRRGLEELSKAVKKWSGKNKSGDNDSVSSAETRKKKSKESIKGESSKED